MADGEVVEFSRGRDHGLIDLLDEVVHLAIYVFNKPIDLLFRPFHHQLNTTVGKIFDITRDVVLHCEIFDSVSKPDSLHAAIIMA